MWKCPSHDRCLEKIEKKNVPFQIQKFVSLLNMKMFAYFFFEFCLGFSMYNRSTRKRSISHRQCFTRFSPGKKRQKSLIIPTPHPKKKRATDTCVIDLEELLETIHGPIAFHCRSDFSTLSIKRKKCIRNVGGFFVVLILFFCSMFLLAARAWYRHRFWFALGDWRMDNLKKDKTR